MSDPCILKSAERHVSDQTGKPRIFVTGDSHTGTVEAALKQGLVSLADFDVVIDRIKKTKNGVTAGTIEFEDLEHAVGQLRDGDAVVSMIGGNHHHSFALAQHPQPFRVFGSAGDAELRPEREVIPRNTVQAALHLLQKKEVARIERLARWSRVPVFHVFSPPPREQDRELLEGRTASALISLMLQNGVSPAELRMEMWRIQNEDIKSHCSKIPLRFITPPEETVNARGFLLRAYQSDDRTHANSAYGALLLMKMLKEIQA